MSAKTPQALHKQIEQSRAAEEGGAEDKPTTIPSGGGRVSPTPPPSAAPKSSGRHNPTKQVFEFISAISAAAAGEPDADIEDLLEDMGFTKGGTGGEEEVESIDADGLFGASGSSGSFSFQMESSDTKSTAMSFAPGSNKVGGGAAGKTARLNATLSRFGCTLFHRCWVPDEDAKDSSSDDDPGAGGDDAEAERARHRAARKKRRMKQGQSSSERAREEAAILNEIRPWRGEACIMFIDLSGYSTIASHLTKKGGAHALSSAVNSYFETILSVAVTQYKGDVLTFAGDAIVIAWPVVAVERTPLEAVLSACACAMDLQRKCGMSPVAGTDLSFRLHIGVTFGDIQVEILTSDPPSSQSGGSGGKKDSAMQRAYPFVSGRPLAETASVVDTAKSGEVCITKDVYHLGKKYFETTERTYKPGGEGEESSSGTTVYLLSSLDDDHTEAFSLVDTSEAPPNLPWITQNIVPPSVGRKLRQGFKAAHIAEMRSLCVLFLKKSVSDSVATEEWFREVQRILDSNRCPIVQMLHDDKGTHVIAAVNLYRTERVPATVGLVAARALAEAECGVQVGMACGEVFCGITGGDAAARWDITGPAVVRAARLMQHAEKIDATVVCDESVYEGCDDNSQLSIFSNPIHLKGSKGSVKIYRLSSSSITVTSAVRNTSWINPMVHSEERKIFADALMAPYDRGVSLVSGPIGCGKQTLIDGTAQTMGYTTMVHALSRDPQPLAALSTFAAWFAHHQNKAISAVAKEMCSALDSGRKQTRSLALGHQLIELIIEHGLKVCLIIAYAQFMDGPSLAFFKSIATPMGEGWCKKWVPTSAEDLAKRGKLRVVFTTYPLAGTRTVDSLVEEFSRGLVENDRLLKVAEKEVKCAETFKAFSLQREMVHVPMHYARDVKEYQYMLSGHSFFLPTDHCAQIAYEATGGCVGLAASMHMHLRANFVDKAYTKHGENEFVSNSRYLKLARECDDAVLHCDPKVTSPSKLAPDAAKRRDEEALALEAKIREEVFWFWEEGAEIHCTQRGEDYLMREIEWRKVSPNMCSRFLELYDVLSPRHQLLLRVVAAVSTTTGSCNIYHAAGIMKKLNAKIAQETTFNDLQQLKNYNILKDETASGDEGEVMFACPAMLDVVSALLTPEQDKTLKRFAYKALLQAIDDFGNGSIDQMLSEHQWRPIFCSFVARLANAAGSKDDYKTYLKQSWKYCLTSTEGEDKPFPDIRARMEERLLTEKRRNPDVVNADLFQGLEGPMPLFKGFKSEAQLALEKAPIMPEVMEYARGFFPPMGLGAMSGELQKLDWDIINKWVGFTKREGVKLLPDGMESMLFVDPDAFMKAVAKFEEVIPKISDEVQKNIIANEKSETVLVEGLQFEAVFQREPRQQCLIHDGFIPPTTIEEEKKLIVELCAPPKDKLSAFKKQALLRAYFLKVMVPRRDRLNYYVAHMQGDDVLAGKCELTNTTFEVTDKMKVDPLFQAYHFLSKVKDPHFGCSADEIISSGEEPTTPGTAAAATEDSHRNVHHAVLSLAVGGWKSKYFHINLQLIRDFVLRLQSAMPIDFKSMALSLKLFGDELTDLTAFNKRMHDAVAKGI